MILANILSVLLWLGVVWMLSCSMQVCMAKSALCHGVSSSSHVQLCLSPLSTAPYNNLLPMTTVSKAVGSLSLTGSCFIVSQHPCILAHSDLTNSQTMPCRHQTPVSNSQVSGQKQWVDPWWLDSLEDAWKEERSKNTEAACRGNDWGGWPQNHQQRTPSTASLGALWHSILANGTGEKVIPALLSALLAAVQDVSRPGCSRQEQISESSWLPGAQDATTKAVMLINQHWTSFRHTLCCLCP